MSETKVETDVARNTKWATMRSRIYILTWNNFTEEAHTRLQNFGKKYKNSYIAYQHEVGEKTKTPHLQIAIYNKSELSWKSIKEKFHECHVEPGRNIKAVLQYCIKEDTRIEGPWEVNPDNYPEQGRRRDLEEIAQDYINNTEYDFASNDPTSFVRYYKGLRELKAILQEKDRSWQNQQKVIWLWGLAGVGKTRYVFEKHQNVYVKDGTKWWDGYTQNADAIVIDDFDGGWPYRDLLRLLDRYPYQGQTKGGYRKINTEYIYITCEYPPSNYWSGNELDQVTRRLSEIKEIKQLSSSLAVATTKDTRETH